MRNDEFKLSKLLKKWGMGAQYALGGNKSNFMFNYELLDWN